MAERDGFIIRELESGEEINFIASDYDGRMREKVEVGLFHRVDLDRYFVEDTRERASTGEETEA